MNKNRKTALITGASNGIGKELARIHASKGDNLVLVARTKTKLEELKKELSSNHGIDVHVMIKDLSLPSAALDVYTETKHLNLEIDYLINNAGFGDFGQFHKTDWEKEYRMINLNITALTQFTKLFLQDMVSRGHGRIMNVASIASFQPGPGMAVYFATKAYVLSFSEAINSELKDNGITVTALCPGPTQSGFMEASALDNSKLFKGKKHPDSRTVARFGYKAMMKGKAVAIHGTKNYILANSGRFAPRALVVKIAGKMMESLN
ncbi:MAG: SDR family NAD(P)-dependent oxidoreductase [Bacteroidales bacterium]